MSGATHLVAGTLPTSLSEVGTSPFLLLLVRHIVKVAAGGSRREAEPERNNVGWEAIRRRVRNYMIIDGPSQRLVRCGFVLTRDRLKVQSNPTRQGCLGVIPLT